MRFLQSWLSWHPWRIDSVEQCLLFTPSQLRLKVASSSCNEYRYQKVHIEKTVAAAVNYCHFLFLFEFKQDYLSRAFLPTLELGKVD
ncbi:hypothetical protein OUZ56_004667 [Daphnia magna]|uniref:Uncharacterized protein n=1 Tax=Daphnia magna TaxID=35525 RepID=A0ABQ9YQH8_9CRUS|nr:hypothetical protein OUZ56_004667 [Daphnia magna]